MSKQFNNFGKTVKDGKINIDKVWITADTHFFHDNICEGSTKWSNTRPGQLRSFKNAAEMNEVIFNNIDTTVPKDGILIHLGDVVVGAGKDKAGVVYECFKRINRRIIYVVGNHCPSISKLFTSGVGELCQDGIHKEWQYRFSDGTYIHCHHFPLEVWNFADEGGYMLHGHCHNDLPHNGLRRWDVGVDGNNMFPWHLPDLIKKLSEFPSQKDRH